MLPIQRPQRPTPRLAALALALALAQAIVEPAAGADDTPASPALTFFESHCYECHDSPTGKGGLDLESLPLDLADPDTASRWVLIHDRVRDGEMPPKKKPRPDPAETDTFLQALAAPITAFERARVARTGRATIRRLNRFEYENALRDLLAAPWLQVADTLPEDGTDHLFNKVGTRLDVSHVQMSKYLEAATRALQQALGAAAYPTQTERFYARDEPGMQKNLKYRFGQTAATRATIPLLGTTPQPEVIRGNQPVTVGDSDSETREREAFGFVCGTYTATTKYDFTRMTVPTDGQYRIRMKTYTFLAGPNGRNGGDDHGLTGGGQAWWRPSRTEAFPGTRSEPVTLYALAPSGDSRWLATFDSFPEPAVIERTAALQAGEAIRPDATRLVRTRPGWDGNPNATEDGIPGFAMNWLELEGPLHESWPPSSYTALFGDLPFNIDEDGGVRVQPENPEAAALELVASFVRRAYLRPVEDADSEPFLAIYRRATELGEPFTDAVLAAFASVLCSPGFLYSTSGPGPLDDDALAARLSYFLWNGPPDDALRNSRPTSGPQTLRAQTDRLLDHPHSARFLNAFLDFWLDLREIDANAPDAELYPDYYLDDLLTESSVRETRQFFSHLIENDLPVRNLVESDFAFLNERLARHYGLPTFEGVDLRRVDLPEDSPRGGLLTQASVLRVTANGTTTSPVIRGAWIMERILGTEIPPPPSGVAAVEPDTRGATTIREQLDLHRASESCNACHAKFDPAGFALESFDVAGGWRDHYRALGGAGTPAEGIGKNGHRFRFRHAQPVDPTGTMADERPFADIRELKALLATDERQLARNLVNRLVVYATGAPVSFADRAEVESILDSCTESGLGLRSLIHALVGSPLFLNR